ncbi:MAG: hypothetical protein KA087_05465 [Candidatus Saccharicenans sp.]|nr:hypothetical protein [Candidatus Saccharicenans sp.]
MSNSEMILELLGDIYPARYCDDCLSKELSIRPRQQVNQICRKLEGKGKLVRQDGLCEKCKKEKKTNTLKRNIQIAPITRHSQVKESNVSYGLRRSYEDTDAIEGLRSGIVKICRQIWSKNKSEEAPRSVSKMINILKEDGLVPFLQASMMLTICSLRNAYLYENAKMSQKEMAIASNAWDIILEWWKKRNGQDNLHS